MIVETNPHLFRRIADVGNRIKCLASIVQNDHRITREQFAKWKKQAAIIKRDLDNLVLSVALHVRRCNDGR